MNNVTESLRSSVDYQSHVKGLERAQMYLVCIRKANLRAKSKARDAKTTWAGPDYVKQCLKKSASAAAAEVKLTKSYKRILFNLFYKD